jgi:quercetin dioxygenase-like cupin family protein
MPYDPPDAGRNQPLVRLAELEASFGPAPWRCPLVASPSVRVVLLCMTPGTRTIPHLHPRAVEAFQVVRGVVGLTIGDDPEYLAEPGQFLLARRGVIHAIRVPGPDSALLMCIVAPNEDSVDEQIEFPVSHETTGTPPARDVPAAAVPSPTGR